MLKTDSGNLAVELDGAEKPCTVGSFLSLAEQGYYEGSGCHRMADAPGFAFLQCGDPTGTGAGGPGYTIPDEITGEETYPAGTIAMANTGAPDSGGGQFFMIFPTIRTLQRLAQFADVEAVLAAVAGERPLWVSSPRSGLLAGKDGGHQWGRHELRMCVVHVHPHVDVVPDQFEIALACCEVQLLPVPA